MKPCAVQTPARFPNRPVRSKRILARFPNRPVRSKRILARFPNRPVRSKRSPRPSPPHSHSHPLSREPPSRESGGVATSHR